MRFSRLLKAKLKLSKLNNWKKRCPKFHNLLKWSTSQLRTEKLKNLKRNPNSKSEAVVVAALDVKN